MDFARFERIPLFQALLQSESTPLYEAKTYADWLKDLAREMAGLYPSINQGLTAVDSDIWFTDHGAGHAIHVIERISELLNGSEALTIISPHEAYVLIAAALLHDAGNLWGRDQHERRVTRTMARLSEGVLPTDTILHRQIADIASAHGGAVAGDQDTIGKLQWDMIFESTQADDVRVHLLAAILRFADELSDDSTRASRFEEAELLKGSEVYHRYAVSLQKVRIRPSEKVIQLQYVLFGSDVTKPVRKGSDTVFMFDYVLERLLKLYREFLYCSRFLKPAVIYKDITVKIDVCRKDVHRPEKRFHTVLREHGYPAISSLDEVTSDFDGWTGQRLRDFVDDGTIRTGGTT